MFSIGICDDDALCRQHIRELCEQYFAESPQAHEFVEFVSGEEVLAYHDSFLKVDSESSFDGRLLPKKLLLLFLDVEMGEVDGIEVLRKVEQSDWIWRVVFVTSHDEIMLDAFGIKTLGFIKKPVEYRQIEKWLQVAIRENKDNVVLEYVSGTQQCYIALEDVYYLEAEGNYTYLHTKNESILINENLKQWQYRVEQMPLVRIHKSYLINMLHAQRWERNKVKLTNGEELVIGRQFAKAAKESHMAFVKKQAMKRI